MNRTIIFDFDGTIADTLDSVVKIVNNHAEHFGYNKVKKEDIPHLQRKKPMEILSHLGISVFKLPLWIKKIHSEINKEISNMRPTVDILPILSELHEDESCSLGILTSNTRENVKEFLVRNEMNFFDFIYTGKSVFGKSHMISKIIKQRKVSKSEVFYVCDEVRDLEAARKSGIKSVAVTWGYNSKDALMKENSDFLVNTPTELRNIIIS